MRKPHLQNGASVERIAPARRLLSVAKTYFPAIDGTAVLIQHLAE